MKRKSVSSSWRNHNWVIDLMVTIEVKMETGTEIIELSGQNMVNDDFLVELSNRIMSVAGKGGIQMGIKSRKK